VDFAQVEKRRYSGGDIPMEQDSIKSTREVGLRSAVGGPFGESKAGCEELGGSFGRTFWGETTIVSMPILWQAIVPTMLC
jgi:hypothetical protein